MRKNSGRTWKPTVKATKTLKNERLIDGLSSKNNLFHNCFILSLCCSAPVEHLLTAFMRLVDKRRVIHRHYDKIIIRRQPPSKILTERAGVLPGSHGTQNITVDIVEPECARAKNIVRVDQMDALPHFPVNFHMAVRIIDVKEHDPSGRREQEFEFGKVFWGDGIQIKGPGGFIVKNKQPENDKNADRRIARARVFRKIDNDNGRDQKDKKACHGEPARQIDPQVSAGKNQQCAADFVLTQHLSR